MRERRVEGVDTGENRVSVSEGTMWYPAAGGGHRLLLYLERTQINWKGRERGEEGADGERFVCLVVGWLLNVPATG